MEPIAKIYSEICVPTDTLKIELIQELLLKAKQYHKSPKENNDIWNNITQLLWSHLQSCFKKLDDQLLCATCFFSVLTLSNLEEYFISEFLKNINDELTCRTNNDKSMKTCQVMSLAYGMFQSSFITQCTNDHITIIGSVLKSTVNLLVHMAYDYSQYTFLVFKTIKSFTKACGTHLHKIIFNEEYLNKLLNLVNHNWENPITGVRDLNRSIFQMVIRNLDDDMYMKVLVDINQFYWNKGKYLMLSEIIECKRSEIFYEHHDSKWIDGLLNSLYRPGLVSAGADMYYSLLKQLKSEEQWCNMFLTHIINILCSGHIKAIENFNNYWCLTTLKKFPSVVGKIIEKLNNLDESKLFSGLYIIRQGNKLGLIDKEWDSIDNYTVIEKSVLCGMEHCNNYVRMLAFEIVCVSQNKLMPTETEYRLILGFLANNINSDCTVLRLNMLNGFKIFLSRLHSLYLNTLMKANNSCDIRNLLHFFIKLQAFVAESINVNGNYQRKITSVKLCEVILNCVAEVPKKKRAQTRQNHKPLLIYLKDKGNWPLSDEDFFQKLVSFLRDPAEDVRENILRILLNHYSSELQRGTSIQSLIKDALTYMKSKFFYEISCGQSIFKLLTNLLMREKYLGSEFQNVEDIFNFAYNELITEYILNRDLMKSIENGKQLNSFMSIMIVVLEECYSNSYKIDISGVTVELLDTLEGISNQLNWERDSSTSSDFSKMTEMVQDIIANSGYNPCDDTDQTKISGLQQIVLNSLWLNVKASCDLASIMIKINPEDISMCQKCLDIIAHVLERSRHKGVIEAAGAALGRAIQYLTSLPEKNAVFELPYILLEGKLHDLVSETNKMSSITRRGAGLSIMVHRIVSSDMTKGKPLFHYFMNNLLKLCLKSKDTPDEKSNDEDENQIDLPKAIYIHFMTRIVTDSSLTSELMFYSAKLAELAFMNLVSPHWQIRNAALQLYGALIPRQIGQKKASGDDEETIATVAFDELQTHNSNLWHYIIGQLMKQDTYDKIQYHSNLVPILNMFASIARRYNFGYNMEKYANDELLQYFIPLLGSPIFTVRRLTAKCIFNIFEFPTISTVLLNEKEESENFLHGSLILISLCHKQYYSEGIYNGLFNFLKEKYDNVLRRGPHSYMCKEIYEDIYIKEYGEQDINLTFSEMKNNIYNPGVFSWGEKRLQKYIATCTWSEIPQILKQMLQQNEYKNYCQLILSKLKADSIEIEVLLKIADIFVSFENSNDSSAIWEIIYEISKKIDLNELDNAKYLVKLSDRKRIYQLRYMVPLIARNIRKLTNENKIVFVNIVNDLCNFEDSDVDMRYIATIAINEIASHFKLLDDRLKIILIKCAILLLQDEDEDVRNLSVNFYKILCGVQLNPYICLINIMDRKSLQNLFCDPRTSIQELCKQLTDVLQTSYNVNDDEYNPFTNHCKNIYLETEILKKMIENIKCD